jgi:hypothetical protein
MALNLRYGTPEVWPVEAALEDLTLLEVQLQDHVRLDPRRGCGSQGHDRDLHMIGRMGDTQPQYVGGEY